MAFRIHESVVRSEVGNRLEAVVHGGIWMKHPAEPALLEFDREVSPGCSGLEVQPLI
jgi:hypothetical protein